MAQLRNSCTCVTCEVAGNRGTSSSAATTVSWCVSSRKIVGVSWAFHLVELVASGEATPAGVAGKLAGRLRGLPSVPREAYVAMLVGVSRGGESGVAECVALTAGEMGIGGKVEMVAVLLAVSPRGECERGGVVSGVLEVGVSRGDEG